MSKRRNPKSGTKPKQAPRSTPDARKRKLARSRQLVITADPVESFTPGDEINFKPHFVRFHGPPLSKVNNWEGSDGIVLGITFAGLDDDGRVCYRVLGSAVMVSPGVALTASHVVRNELQQLQANTQNMALFGFTAEGGMTFWRPRHLTAIDGTDTTIVSLKYATHLPKGPLRFAGLTTRTPKEGESVTIVGYVPKEKKFYEEPDSKARKLNLTLDLHMCTAVVVEVHREKRDNGMLNFPCMHIDGPSLGSMSGGAAFDSSGRVVGIIASGLDSEEIPPYSYVSLLRRTFCCPFLPSWPRDMELTNLRNIAEAGWADIEGLDKVMCGYDAEAKAYDTRLGEW